MSAPLTVYELMEMAEAYAVEAKFNPTEEGLWRSIERQYSKTFATPLHQVKDLDPLEVLKSLYENRMEGLKLREDEDFNELLDTLYRLQDPEYDAKKESDELAYNEQAVKEEEERLAKIAAKKTKKAAKDADANPVVDPKQGGINLEYLSRDRDNEG